MISGITIITVVVKNCNAIFMTTMHLLLNPADDFNAVRGKVLSILYGSCPTSPGECIL